MSKITDEKELLKKLAGFGLGEKESRVYFSLLPYRDIGSSKIIRATGLHGQFVYDALEKLEEFGLAKHVIQNGRKKFSANSPKRILSLLEEKKLSAQSVVRQLQTRFAGAHEQDFEVLQGVNAFVAHQMAMIESVPENSTIDVISGPNDQYFTTLGDEGVAEEYEHIRAKKNIRIRYIGANSQLEKFKRWERERKHWTYKIFPGLSTGLVDIGVWHDSVIFNIYGNPLLSFVLTSKEIADGYRQFFDAIWNLSSK